VANIGSRASPTPPRRDAGGNLMRLEDEALFIMTTL